jgi:DnaJ-class molecular chaperone
MSLNADNYFDQALSDFNATGSESVDGRDLRGGMFADGFRGQAEDHGRNPEDVEVTIECTLKELYIGSMKQISFERAEIHHMPKVAQNFTRTKQVEVKPGYSDKTVLVFKGEGNAACNKPTSNLVVKFRQTEHPHIKRSGDDLVMTVPVSFEDAIRQTPVTFRTLDERNITIQPDQQVSPQSCVLVANEGMPSGRTRGNLYLKFDVKFPTDLNGSTIAKLIAALKQNEEDC